MTSNTSFAEGAVEGRS